MYNNKDNFIQTFATKDDLKSLELRLDSRIDHLEYRIDHLGQQLNGRINTMESILSAKINNVDTKLNWLVTLMGAIGVMLAFTNFLHLR